MYISVIKIYPPPGCEKAVIDILDTLKGPVDANTDSLGCTVALEGDEGSEGKAVCYTERWRTREALDGHLRSPLYGRLLEAMECSCKAPEVEFYEATDVGGLELVEKARTTKKTTPGGIQERGEI